MHLRKNDDTIRSGLLPNVDTKNGAEQILVQKGARTTSSLDHSVETNIPIEEQNMETLFETLLAGWILLAQRYQRDSFHRFTWGITIPGEKEAHIVEAEELKLPGLERVEGLLAQVRNSTVITLPKDLQLSSLHFNDGTPDEVSAGYSLGRISADCFTSGHLL